MYFFIVLSLISIVVHHNDKSPFPNGTNQINVFRMIFTTHENPDHLEVDKLRAALRAFNQNIAGEFSYDSSYITVEDPTGELIGGIYGNFAWNWLYIDLLWVHPDYRGKGIGLKLMSAIEKEAHKKDIYSYHLSTASFQAPVFYQKLGYQICGEITDLPPGYTTYFLKKQS